MCSYYVVYVVAHYGVIVGRYGSKLSLQISPQDLLYKNQRQQHHICSIYITQLDAIIRVRRLGALV